MRREVEGKQKRRNENEIKTEENGRGRRGVKLKNLEKEMTRTEKCWKDIAKEDIKRE